MRQPVDGERIRAFARELGREARSDTKLYLTGGASAVLFGWRAATASRAVTARICASASVSPPGNRTEEGACCTLFHRVVRVSWARLFPSAPGSAAARSTKTAAIAGMGSVEPFVLSVFGWSM